MATAPATEAQIKFIDTLLNQRQLTEALTQIDPTGLNRVSASVVIETLKALPYKPRPQVAVSPVSKRLVDAGIPTSKYAIPFEELFGTIPGVRESSGHLFLEVKTFKGVTYMRRLHGSLGDFTRSKLPTAVTLDLILFMGGRVLEFAQEFGRLYTCCGSCGAPLTDERSREVHLGPECRKKFGL